MKAVVPGLSTFRLYRISKPVMKETGTTNPEYQPLQVLWCLFMHPNSKIILLAPIHSFTRQIVPTLYQQLSTWGSLQSIILLFHINSLFPSITFLRVCHFFFVSNTFFHFHRTLFVNPGSFSNSLFVHSLVCQITQSFLNGFQPNLCKHFPHVCCTYHTIFSLK